MYSSTSLCGKTRNVSASIARTQASADWLSAHVRALEAFGCAPRALVPDNCSTAVKKALRYDPQYRTYESKDDYVQRLRADLRHSRDEIEHETGQRPRAIVWP